MKQLKKIQLTDPENSLEEKESTTEIVPVEELEGDGGFGEISKWFDKMKEKVKPFPWKRINAKNAMIAGCLVIVAVAGYLNIRYGPTGEITPPVTDQDAVAEEKEENFFATALIDRERARGEALEVLVNITEDETASETAKEEAFHQMERIANETSWEIDIENLVKAMGFEECVAIINDNTANVVVESSGLSAGQIAQIKEIVFLEASIQPKDVKIIEKDIV
jgi:stage III sporulation protein AH